MKELEKSKKIRKKIVFLDVQQIVVLGIQGKIY